MINKNKLGLAFGTFLGIWHFVWGLLVLSGLSQSLMNIVFRLHMIEPPYTVVPFDFGTAVALILVTSMTGYLSGWVLGAIWNWVRADSSSTAPSSAAMRRQPATGH